MSFESFASRHLWHVVCITSFSSCNMCHVICVTCTSRVTSEVQHHIYCLWKVYRKFLLYLLGKCCILVCKPLFALIISNFIDSVVNIILACSKEKACSLITFSKYLGKQNIFPNLYNAFDTTQRHWDNHFTHIFWIGITL